MDNVDNVDNVNLEYTIDKATTEELLEFFKLTDEFFDPPLHSFVDLEAYAVKIRTYARTSEVWDNGRLIGYSAAYVNDVNKKDAYALNLALLPEYRKKYNIFQTLRDIGIEAIRKEGFERIIFDVQKKAPALINYYLENGYEILGDKNEDYVTMGIYLK